VRLSSLVPTAILLLTCIMPGTLLIGGSVRAQVASDDSDARPPVANVDLEIVRRDREILDSPSKWNRADNRVCPETTKTFSLYCALEKATTEKTGVLSIEVLPCRKHGS
jgi:hypothetical protein